MASPGDDSLPSLVGLIGLKLPLEDPPSDESRCLSTLHSFGGTSVTIRSIPKRDYYGTDVELSGFSSWFASTLFSQFACQEQRAVTLFGGGRSILELGSGAGMAGCALAKCLQRLGEPMGVIVLTDGEKQVVDLLRSNIADNGLSAGVMCQELLWCPSPTLDELIRCNPQGFTVIFGCDLLYNAAQGAKVLGGLFHVVDTLLSRTPGSAFYLAFTRRDLDLATVFEAGHQCGFLADLQEDYVYDIFGSNTDGMTEFWRDAVYRFYRPGRG